VNERTADDWESHWDRYAESASLNPAQAMRHATVVSALRTLAWPTEHLLDVGSGQGDFLSMALQAGAAREYAGFELSESGVAYARAKLPGAAFMRVDLFAPPAEASRFAGWATTAVCSEVVEHVDEPVAFLSALRTYMADGARLVLTVPGGPMSTFDRYIGHRRHYTKALAREVLEQAGFDVETVWLAGFPFFNLYRLLVILRGAALIEDAKSGAGNTGAKGLARIAMSVFAVLFKLNVRNSPFGWQIVAIARKR